MKAFTRTLHEVLYVFIWERIHSTHDFLDWINFCSFYGFYKPRKESAQFSPPQLLDNYIAMMMMKKNIEPIQSHEFIYRRQKTISSIKILGSSDTNWWIPKDSEFISKLINFVSKKNISNDVHYYLLDWFL